MADVYVPALVIHPDRTADLRYVRVFNEGERRHWIESVGPYTFVPPDAPAAYKRIISLDCKPRDLPTVSDPLVNQGACSITDQLWSQTATTAG